MTTIEHVHHWILGAPDGSPTVPGICRHCGAKRAYRTAWDEERKTITITHRDNSRGALLKMVELGYADKTLGHAGVLSAQYIRTSKALE